MALIDKNDYRDYYLARGWSSFVGYDHSKKLALSLQFLDEKQSSMVNKASKGLFSSQKTFRTNPPAGEGRLRSLEFSFRLGEKAVPLELVPRDALEFSVEHASPRTFGGAFGFTRYKIDADYHMRTFARSLLFSPSLKIKLSAGASSGVLPPQRKFVIDSRASSYAPFGVLKGSGIKEFSGDSFVKLNVEHNFRSTPFLLLDIPFLHRNGIELITHFSAAKTWGDNEASPKGWYSEAGLGLSKIFDILRADVTYRMSPGRALFFTLAVANIF
jgi:hypothetical protein